MRVRLTRKGKGTKLRVVVDVRGIPLGLSVDSAGVGEPQMVQGTLELFASHTPPERLIGDKAYVSDETRRNPR